MKDLKSLISGQLDNHFPNMGTKILDGASSLAGALNFGPLDGFYHEGYHWAGLSKAEMVSNYHGLNALGVQQKEYYIIRFSPYRNNGVKDIPLVKESLSGWLATSVSWPILQVDTEVKKAGNYSYSHVTGRQFPEITINMIETKSNTVLHSMVMLRNLMFNKDGTFSPPAKYAMWIEMFLYNREKGVANRTSRASALCYPTVASIDVDAADHGALILPITFARTRPFMGV